jgi:hypothetical protein
MQARYSIPVACSIFQVNFPSDSGIFSVAYRVSIVYHLAIQKRYTHQINDKLYVNSVIIIEIFYRQKKK